MPIRNINVSEYVLEILRCRLKKVSIFPLKLSFLVVICGAVKLQCVMKIKIQSS